MAYRRRQGVSRASTFKEEIIHHPSLDLDRHHNHNNNNNNNLSHATPALFPSYSFTTTTSPSSPLASSSSPSLAAQAIKASAARRDPSLAFAFADSSNFGPPSHHHDHQRSKSFDAYGDSLGRGDPDPDPKSGFWGVLAEKAKSILEDDNSSPKSFDIMPQRLRSFSFNSFSGHGTPAAQFKPSYQYHESHRKMDNPTFRKGLDAISTSLNQLGDTFEKAFEEGRTIVENKTANLRTQMRRKGPEYSNQGASGGRNPWQQYAGQTTQPLNSQETQLKASRDVAMATAAKAKLLLRELKTVKADLAFAKARCAQLEEENKLLRDREGSDKGQTREDDDLIRLQLETLLAEKARLANENEIYSRENRFLREIVEYHQLTMQDVVYFDDGIEEEEEVYPMDASRGPQSLSVSPRSSSPPSPEFLPSSATASPMKQAKRIFPAVPEEEYKSTSEDEASPRYSVSEDEHAK